MAQKAQSRCSSPENCEVWTFWKKVRSFLALMQHRLDCCKVTLIFFWHFFLFHHFSSSVSFVLISREDRLRGVEIFETYFYFCILHAEKLLAFQPHFEQLQDCVWFETRVMSTKTEREQAESVTFNINHRFPWNVPFVQPPFCFFFFFVYYYHDYYFSNNGHAKKERKNPDNEPALRWAMSSSNLLIT